MDSCHDLQPWVAGKSVLEVSEAVRRLYLSQNKSDLDDNFFVSSSRCSLGVHYILAFWLDFLKKHFGKGPQVVYMSFFMKHPKHPLLILSS